AEKAPPAADVIEEQLRDHEARMAAAAVEARPATNGAGVPTAEADEQRDMYPATVGPAADANQENPMSPRNCSACGKTFEPTRADAQYCSDACRQRAHRNRVRCVTDNTPVTDNQDGTADEQHGAVHNPSPEAPTRNDQVMAAIEILAAQAPERAAQ